MALLDRVPFASFAAYSPRETDRRSRLSRTMCYAAKEDGSVVLDGRRMQVIPRMVSRLEAKIADSNIADWFADDPVLVPAPRSTPHIEGNVWPPRVIAHQLVAAGFGRSVRLLLQRTREVPKASRSAPADRPTAPVHYRTLRVLRPVQVPDSILIVDDVITSGCMLLAAASRLQEAFPESRVRAFALIRTESEGPIANIYDPCRGAITLRADGERTYRRP